MPLRRNLRPKKEVCHVPSIRHVCVAENVTVTYDHDYSLEPLDGDKYMVIHNPRATVTPGRAYIQLTNLFNGDPVLGE
jgi:hypothetical protein